MVEIARKESLDLIVLDVMLPDISGFEVCRSIRRDPKLYTLPIIILSAMDDSEEVQHGLEQGADGYITKPFDMQLLVQRVERLLQASIESDLLDHQTELADGEGTRKLLQQHISRNESFGLIYIELKNLREVHSSSDDKIQDKVLRHFARAMRLYGEEFEAESFFVGHLGGGHFICMLPRGVEQDFCRTVQKGWKRHYESICSSFGISTKVELGVIFCVTAREKGESVSAHQMLETVSKIHKVAENEGLVDAIQMDRRML